MNNLLVYLAAAWIVIAIIRTIYDLINNNLYHWGWSKDARPDVNAVIVSAKPEFVNMKAFSKFKTTIKFSDGFWFTSPATKKSTKIARYEFSVDEEQLKSDMERAMRTHRKEAEARLKKEGHKRDESPTGNSQGAPTPGDIDVDGIASEKREVSDIRL
jgi:hypothetical protein